MIRITALATALLVTAAASAETTPGRPSAAGVPKIDYAPAPKPAGAYSKPAAVTPEETPVASRYHRAPPQIWLWLGFGG